MIRLVAADSTGMPVNRFILRLVAVILMCYSPRATTNIAGSITCIVISMCGQFGDGFGLSCITTSAGIGFDTIFLAGSLLGYGACVPVVNR